jgi:hypothetical protein
MDDTRPPPGRHVGPRGLRWLLTVATREAWRLASTAHEIPVGAFLGTTTDQDDQHGTMSEPPGDTPGPLDQVAARLHHTARVGTSDA